jgi:hypothetical protein
MVKRVSKGSDGKYHIKGKTYEQLVGSRAQVHHGTAYKTAGNLIKSDLLMNKHGRIVSSKKHATAKRDKRLVKAGYLTRKGKFGAIKSGKLITRKSSKSRSSSRGKKMRGGRREDEVDLDETDAVVSDENQIVN